MIGLALMLAVTTASPVVSPSPMPSPAVLQQLRLECRDADTVLPTFSKAALSTDLNAAKADYEAIITNCGDSPPGFIARVHRAQLAWRDGDASGVLTWLKGVPRVGPNRVNLEASMLVMKADQQLGDHAGFAAERAAVQAAVERALGSKGQKLDNFDVNGAKVAVYAAPLDQKPFRRLIEMLISPADADAMPQSIMLTDDLNVRMIFKQMNKGGVAPPYYLDAYTCTSHQTIKMVAGHGDAPPTYEEIKPLVIAYLNDGAWATETTKGGGAACAWPQYLAPGISN